jgi:hypothetical protein
LGEGEERNSKFKIQNAKGESETGAFNWFSILHFEFCILISPLPHEGDAGEPAR